MSTEPTALQVITAIGSVATPILVLFLAGIGWRFRASLERRFKLEDELRQDRIQTYNDILEPFVLLLMSETAWQSDPKNKSRDKNAIATQKLLSLEYRRKTFQMSLVGADEVVRAFNNLMQYFFQRPVQREGEMTSDEAKELMGLIGNFLLEIRRSMGNDATKLDHWEMLEYFISDARKYRFS